MTDFGNIAIDPSGDPPFDIVPKLINGSIAGLLGILTLFPLDSVKTRLQYQKKSAYNGVFHGMLHIYRSEGLRSLYHGMGVTMALVTPEIALKMSINDYFRHLLQVQNGDLTLIQQTFAGGMAGFAQINVTTPAELIKVQLQKNAAQSLHKNSNFQLLSTMDVYKTIFREYGVTGFFRGYVSTGLRDVIFAMIYFPLYNTLSEKGPSNKRDASKPADWVAFISGCTAGVVAGMAVTPFDVIKTRLQANNEYDGIVDCFRKTLKVDGFRAFFKGMLCRAMFIAPLLGISQMIYSYDVAENLKLYFKQINDEKTDTGAD